MASLPKFLYPREPGWEEKVFSSEHAALRYMCGYDEPNDLESIKERCLEISVDSNTSSWNMPTDEPFWELIFLPMRQANRCYSLGNYLATLALCGFTAERLAYILCEINEISTRQKDKENEISYREIMSHLSSGEAPIIPNDVHALFKKVRKLRNNYLHSPIGVNFTSISSDAIESYTCVNKIFDWLFSQYQKNGKWQFCNRALEKYLARRK